MEQLQELHHLAHLGNGREGLIHISQIADEHIRRVEDYVKIGEKVTVRVLGIDPQGRINLTMKAFAPKVETEENKE